MKIPNPDMVGSKSRRVTQARKRRDLKMMMVTLLNSVPNCQVSIGDVLLCYILRSLTKQSLVLHSCSLAVADDIYCCCVGTVARRAAAGRGVLASENPRRFSPNQALLWNLIYLILDLISYNCINWVNHATTLQLTAHSRIHLLEICRFVIRMLLYCLRHCWFG